MITLELGGRHITFGIVEMPKPELDWTSPLLTEAVLIKVEAVSCNFRDRSYVAIVHDQLTSNPQIPAAHFGSDFAGIVVEKGSGVTGIDLGERVIPSMTYGSEHAGGVPTNRATQGWLVLSQRSVTLAPEAWSVAQSAAASLGAQTARAMARRSGVKPGNDVLICSGRSSTSQFLVQILRSMGIDSVISSSSVWSENEVEALNRPLFDYTNCQNTSPGNSEQSATNSVSTSERRGTTVLSPVGLNELELGSFDVVFDPFADLHLARSIELLRSYGTYISCGFVRQYHQEEYFPPMELSSLRLIQIMVAKNLTIIGNCLGEDRDLAQGLELLGNGSGVPLDSEWEIDETWEFLRRSFGTEKSILGKVVLHYDS